MGWLGLQYRQTRKRARQRMRRAEQATFPTTPASAQPMTVAIALAAVDSAGIVSRTSRLIADEGPLGDVAVRNLE